MKMMLKKSMSILLAFTLLFGSLAFEFSDVNLADFAVKAKAEDAATSGTCGENLTWNFEESTGTLTINGTGEMINWSSSSDMPWYSFCSSIKNITIENAITNIGRFAFYSCAALESVIIPDSVTSIEAFAFYYCSNLENVIIGKNVKNIGDSAFYQCSSLINITIPDTITSIGQNAFSQTGLYNDSSNWDNNVFYVENYLIKAKQNIMGEYLIKKGTKVIADYAFYNCVNLTNIEIPNSVTNIGYSAFMYCSIDNLSIPDSVVSIDAKAFALCSNLTSIELSSNLINIGGATFYRCSKIETIVFPKGLTIIGEKMFFNCGGITSIEIPDSVINIGEYAFFDCTSLTSVEIPDSVTSIGYSAFSACTGLASVEIPNSVTSIGDEAFCECFSLEYIHIPSSVTSLGESVVSSDANKTEQLESVKTELENATEEELAYYAEMGITKENIAKWSTIKTVICSDTNDCVAKTYAETNGNKFVVCDGHDTTGSEEPTTKPVEIPTTTKPAVTEPSTTKPVVEPTTKPTVTEPSTTEPTKPVETTKPTTAPTTKPESTTKPEPIEEEIVKKPSTSEIKYGETLILHADLTNVPEGAKIEWSVEGKGVTITPSADGKTCAVTSTSTGDVTVTAKYTDANGVEHVSEQEIKSNASFWQKIVSFFKNLFGINRVIEQRIKF